MKWQIFKTQTPTPTKAPPARPVVETFHAVEIVSTGECCQAAKQASHTRFLSKDVPPTLPLATCDRPQLCQCRYRHHADRRRESRRASDNAWSAQAPLPPGRERRRMAGRRVSDWAEHRS